MATPTLVEFETARTRSILVRDILPGPGWAPYRPDVTGSARDQDFLSAEGVRGDDCVDGKCMKGLLVGVALECVVGLGVVGVWQLWHIVR